MESESHMQNSPLQSSVSSNESMIEIELLMGDMLLYSPLQPAIVPVEPANDNELENDLFNLE